MANRQRIRKLSLGPSDRVTAKNSHVGMTVIADYVSDDDNQRYLVFERPGSAPATRTRKPKTNAKPQPTTQAATAFPPAEAARG